MPRATRGWDYARGAAVLGLFSRTGEPMRGSFANKLKNAGPLWAMLSMVDPQATGILHGELIKDIDCADLAAAIERDVQWLLGKHRRARPERHLDNMLSLQRLRLEGSNGQTSSAALAASG